MTTRRAGQLRFRRILVLPLTAAIGVAVAVPTLLPAAAQAQGAGSGDVGDVTATVILTTPSGAEALAQASDLPRTARLDRLRGSTPSADSRAGLLSQVRNLGLDVVDSSPWSLVVHGSASEVSRVSSVSGVSSVILGGPAPVPAAGQVPLRGSQLRSSYQASSAAPPAAATKPIIATIQFSGWSSAELAGYVTNANQMSGAVHLPAPAAGQYTGVSIGGASVSARSEPGSDEVALDQESLYDTDPFALQRAYFANPNPAGMVAALDRVAADAENLPGLVALSISWTWCSSLLNATDLSSMHAALANVVAAGVTVFASSGDDGAYCGSTGERDVSYPAVDPLVIGVGGTTLTLGPTSEKGWGATVPTTVRPSGFYGSGGGSSHFPAPSWQTSTTGAGDRDVPDIAADADNQTGFYAWHDDGDGSGVGFKQYGGTSLSSTAATAAYVAELGSRGATNGGLGDLHGALYSAPAADFRDITSGSNGGYTAKAGYDMVTGLGAPMWKPIVDRVLTQPVISVPANLASRVVPVSVSAPAGQTFLAWTTGYGNPPASCGSSAGQPTSPSAVTVPADGSYRIWAEGYVGDRHCFIVSTTTVVNTGSPTPPTSPPTTAPTSPPTAAPTTPPTTPPTSAPVTSAPVTSAPVTSAPVSSNPAIPPTLTPTAGPSSQPSVGPTLPVIPTTDVTPPTVTLSARQTSVGTAAVSYTWRASDAGSGVASVQVTVFRDGRPVWTQQVKPSASLTLNGAAGHVYRLGVVAADVAGNTAGFASNSVRLPYDDRSFAVSKGWSRAASHQAFDGSYVKSSKKGASASIKAVGKTFSLLTSVGPAEGMVAVYVDGKHVRDLSLYSKTSRTQVVVILARYHTAGTHRITLLVKGKRAPHGRGAAVDLDGLLAV